MTLKKNEQNYLSVPFHRLTEEELRQWYEDKLIATTGYLLAIRKIKAPPGVSFTIPNVLKFCEDWGIARSAFYRAVDYLRDKGYFTWEATHGIILSDSKKIISFPTEKKCPTDGTQLQQRDIKSHEGDVKSHKRNTKSRHQDTSSLKPARRSKSGTPQIYTDKTDMQTLSDMPLEERENFEKFVREEWKRTKGKEIDSFNAVVRGEFFQEWYQKYQNRPELVQAAQNAKWENHTRCDEWLTEIERTLNPLEFAGTDKEKLAFVNWCWETKQFSWLQEEGNE